MRHPLSITELTKLLKPFVGTFREHHRGDGSRVDISHLVRSIDADIRAVDANGIKIVFDGFGEVVPWSAITGLTITKGGVATTYQVAPALKVAA